MLLFMMVLELCIVRIYLMQELGKERRQTAKLREGAKSGTASGGQRSGGASPSRQKSNAFTADAQGGVSEREAEGVPPGGSIAPNGAILASLQRLEPAFLSILSSTVVG